MGSGAPDVLLAKPVRTMRGMAVVAVNHSKSARGIYQRLKHSYETDPAARATLDANIRYLEMLKHERQSGAPTFEQSLPQGAHNELERKPKGAGG